MDVQGCRMQVEGLFAPSKISRAVGLGVHVKARTAGRYSCCFSLFTSSLHHSIHHLNDRPPRLTADVDTSDVRASPTRLSIRTTSPIPFRTPRHRDGSLLKSESLRHTVAWTLLGYGCRRRDCFRNGPRAVTQCRYQPWSSA